MIDFQAKDTWFDLGIGLKSLEGYVRKASGVKLWQINFVVTNGAMAKSTIFSDILVYPPYQTVVVMYGAHMGPNLYPLPWLDSPLQAPVPVWNVGYIWAPQCALPGGQTMPRLWAYCGYSMLWPTIGLTVGCSTRADLGHKLQNNLFQIFHNKKIYILTHFRTSDVLKCEHQLQIFSYIEWTSDNMSKFCFEHG